MASLLERVGTLVSANLNYLVSKALKANSVAVIDEYIRKIEDNLEALEDAAATVGGEAKGMRRKAQEFQAKAEELDRSIDLFLRSGKEELARSAQSNLNTTMRLADTYKEQAGAQEAEFNTLVDAKNKLEAKLSEVKQERQELQAMLDVAKSKETTHKVVTGVAGATDAESGIAEMRSAIQARLDKATAQGEMDASRLEHQAAEVLEQDTLDAQLAERKRNLG
ncbi:MAG: PspA/IM30 family protein, partial [Anaerolineae bacterium]